MPTQVGTTQQGGANNGNPFTLTFDGTLLEDDVAYLFLGHGTTTAATFGLTAQGWVQQDSVHAGTLQYETWTRVMGSTPDTSVTITPNPDNPQDATHASVVVLRDVDTTTPVDVLSGWAVVGAATTTPDAPAVTTVTDDAWVFTAVGYEATGVPAGYTELSAGFTNDTNATGISLAYREVATAGVEDPGTWTLAPSVAWYVTTVAARPATVASGVTGTDGGGSFAALTATGSAAVTVPEVTGSDGSGSFAALEATGAAAVTVPEVVGTDGGGSFAALTAAGSAVTTVPNVTATDGGGSFAALTATGSAFQGVAGVDATDGGGSFAALTATGTATTTVPEVVGTDGGGSFAALEAAGAATVATPGVTATDGAGSFAVLTATGTGLLGVPDVTATDGGGAFAALTATGSARASQVLSVGASEALPADVSVRRLPADVTVRRLP